jgi:hypothetical protein
VISHRLWQIPTLADVQSRTWAAVPTLTPKQRREACGFSVAWRSAIWQAFHDPRERRTADRAVLPGRPWHGVFTINEGGVVTRWDVTMADAPGVVGDLVVCAAGAIGQASVVQP